MRSPRRPPRQCAPPGGPRRHRRTRATPGPGGLNLLRQALGRHLHEQLESTDLAACLDDHYHALLLRYPGPDTLLEAVAELREGIAAAPLALAGQSIGVRLRALIIIPLTLFSPGVAAPLQNMVLRAQTHMGRPSLGGFVIKAPSEHRTGPLAHQPGDALTLISLAQMACAQAQQSGGDRLVIYQPSAPGPEDVFHEQRIDRLIAQALTEATPGHGFRLFYQPLAVVSPQGRHCLQVLLRLAEEDGALIPSWASCRSRSVAGAPSRSTAG